MRNKLIILSMLSCSMAPAAAQVSIGVGFSNVSIGINLRMYPDLVPVPGYPVYYAPGLDSNYFFYDGMYWVYQSDNWYASSWYNGPWRFIDPEFVPVYVLRVPVRYYRQPPMYFRSWRSDAPPRWGEHWGNNWSQRRSGWDRWDRNATPARPPLPVYQRQYAGDRYPRVEQQQELQKRNYRYQPRDPVVRQQYQAAPMQSAPATRETRSGTQERNPQPHAAERFSSPPSLQNAPTGLRPEPMQRQGPPVRQQSAQPDSGAVQGQQPVSRGHGQEAAPQDDGGRQNSRKGRGPRDENDREQADERDKDHRR